MKLQRQAYGQGVRRCRGAQGWRVFESHSNSSCSGSGQGGRGLPTRPCRAENSKPLVDLRANYFSLTFTAEYLTVYKYTLKVLGSNDKEIRGATAKNIFQVRLGKARSPAL